MATFNLFSDAFLAGDIIPIRHTCEGKDISPPLTWGDPPEGTQSFALICDDPDAPAGDWVHWLLYDIPPNVRGLPQGIEKDPVAPTGAARGATVWTARLCGSLPAVRSWRAPLFLHPLCAGHEARPAPPRPSRTCWRRWKGTSSRKPS